MLSSNSYTFILHYPPNTVEQKYFPFGKKTYVKLERKQMIYEPPKSPKYSRKNRPISFRLPI